MEEKPSIPPVGPPNMNHFADAVDALDAAVFSDDELLNAENRDLFKSSIERWQRKLVEWEEMAAEIERS